MARPIVLTKQLAPADAQAVCASQGMAAAGNLVINGTDATGGVATLDTQRRLLFTSGGNDSGITFTAYGANDAGVAIQETVTGANAGTVATNQDFAKVTRVSASGAVATTIEVGTNTTGSTPWIVPNYHITPFEVAVGFAVMSGAVTASVETSDTSILAPISIYSQGYNQAPPVPTPNGWPGMTGLVGAAQSLINRVCLAIRLTVTGGAGTGQLTINQAGIGGP